MLEPELSRSEEQAAAESLVIAETEEGFRVYAVGKPTEVFHVSGIPEAPRCTCAEVRARAGRCKHVLAVQAQLGSTANHAAAPDPYDAEERRAIQEEGKSRRRRTPRAANGAPAQMLLKRSVSPDGRIDALSVEFSCGLEALDVEAVRKKAADLLGIQAQIAKDFLSGNGTRKSEPVAPEGNGETAPARLVNVAGMDGKWGRRLFINVQVNGETLKLFGSRQQLAQKLRAAGFPRAAETLAEGTGLDLPCRVRTEPSPDGRYTNVVEVLPQQKSPTGQRAQP